MPRVSKVSLPKNQLRDITQHFSSLISALHGNNDVEIFLNEFLTGEEKVMLAKRLVLFLMLHKKYTSEQIKTALHVSYETVRSYQHQFPFKSRSFISLLEKLQAIQQIKDFFAKTEKIFNKLGLLARSASNLKARAKFFSSDDQ